MVPFNKGYVKFGLILDDVLFESRFFKDDQSGRIVVERVLRHDNPSE